MTAIVGLWLSTGGGRWTAVLPGLLGPRPSCTKGGGPAFLGFYGLVSAPVFDHQSLGFNLKGAGR